MGLEAEDCETHAEKKKGKGRWDRVVSRRHANSHALATGTWQSAPGQVKAAVSYAVQNGYKLVDCAYCYGNEDEVGEGLKEAFAAGVKREDVYVVSKVWATYNTRVEECLDKSLKSLGLDYVDLYLVVSGPSMRALFPRSYGRIKEARRC